LPMGLWDSYRTPPQQVNPPTVRLNQPPEQIHFALLNCITALKDSALTIKVICDQTDPNRSAVNGQYYQGVVLSVSEASREGVEWPA